ncbi:site-specific DNA-methyltransferase [Idiomarina sp. M1R2S28]|uniref:Methyltransferase n=1 Tax=Idiomarina rhizosphaerae TaxID=2961572 RepID=A0A9X2FXF3_9GAMM|nr:class I SAM-dependent methyltransferase [Idiomarina rhizosphaerae]MCP1339400.1 site-specific DNA-methyltransferase [Idiomarina rhizosphaerae]
MARKSRILDLCERASSLNQKQLLTLESQFDVNVVGGLENLVNYSPKSERPIHRWFRYREGYSIELVKSMLSELPKNSVILDPFCGAGTTLLAAKELGMKAIGLDVNPMSVLIAKVKTRNYNSSQIDEIRKLTDSVSSLTLDSASDEAPELKIIDKVYHPEILKSLLIIRCFIKAIQNEVSRDFFKVAWLSIIEGTSNVYKEGNGIKYRNKKRSKSGSYTIPIEIWQEEYFPQDKFRFVLETFLKKLAEMLDDIAIPAPDSGITPIVKCAKAEEISNHVNSETVDYVIFSPPYCNCFNYFKIFKIELWMGEFIDSYEDMRKLNSQALRSHVETTLKRDSDKRLPAVEAIVNLVDRDKVWDKRIPDAITGYFVDMNSVLEQCKIVLKDKGFCSAVVGNSVYGGIVIPTDLILASLARDLGYENQHISIARLLPTSAQQQKSLGDKRRYMRESIITLRKGEL